MVSHYLFLLLGNLSYALNLGAFLMRKVVYLRCLALSSSVCAVIYYLLYFDNPLWLNVFWKSVMIAINSGQLLLIWIEARRIGFANPEEELLYNKRFSNLSISDFKKIISVGEHFQADPPEILISEGQPVEWLLLITKGCVSVKLGDKVIAYCRSGNFIGEMSFITESAATATIQVEEPLSAIRWNKNQLKAILKATPEIENNMHFFFNAELVNKLSRTKWEHSSI
jgi:CRP-like cAMP-binding protein